jgi:hypothetical protein
MLLHGWVQAGLQGPMPGQSPAALHDNGFMRHILPWSLRLAPAQWGMPVLTLAIWVALGWSGSAWVLRALQPTTAAQGLVPAPTGAALGVAPGPALIGPEAARLLGAPATSVAEEKRDASASQAEVEAAARAAHAVQGAAGLSHARGAGPQSSRCQGKACEWVAWVCAY